MRRMLISAATALTLMATLAGLSGAERLDQRVDAIRDEWVAVQALPNGPVKAREIDQMRHATARLMSRYPEDARLRHWNRTLTREQRHGGRS